MKMQLKVEFVLVHVFGVPLPAIRVEYNSEKTDSQSAAPGQGKD